MKKVLGLAVLVAIAYACAPNSEKGAETKDTTTVSKEDSVVDARRSRSELAIMMRNIYIDMHDNKELLASGTMPDIELEKYLNVKEAEPTDEEDSGPAFEAFANAYIYQLKKFNNADDSSRIGHYNNLVTSCLNCHQQYCIGPMDIIRTLKIDQ